MVKVYQTGDYKVKIVPFETDHLGFMNFTSFAFQDFIHTRDHSINSLLTLEKLGKSYTALCQGQILGCAGIIPCWKGTADLWMFLGEEAFVKKKFILSIIGSLLNSFIEEYKLHRVQAIVKSDFCQGHRFARFFGFLPEGEMIAYGPNKENFVRYAKVIL